jgi:TolA-binding protein
MVVRWGSAAGGAERWMQRRLARRPVRARGARRRPHGDDRTAAAPDPRTSRLRPRSIPLLVTEIQQLEALASATPDTQPDKVAMLRRLAEDYVELERAANAAGRAQVESSAQKGALKNYDALVAGFASYPLLDEARYFDALEHEAAGDLGAAKRLYYELVSKNPTSRYVPYAYFAFGEMFVSEGADDPSKLDLALQSFQKAVEAPPPDNKLYGWAWFRIGNVEDQKGDASAAHDAYAKAREFATAYPQIPGSNDLLAALPP